MFYQWNVSLMGWTFQRYTKAKCGVFVSVVQGPNRKKCIMSFAPMCDVNETLQIMFHCLIFFFVHFCLYTFAKHTKLHWRHEFVRIESTKCLGIFFWCFLSTTKKHHRSVDNYKRTKILSEEDCIFHRSVLILDICSKQTWKQKLRECFNKEFKIFKLQSNFLTYSNGLKPKK